MLGITKKQARRMFLGRPGVVTFTSRGKRIVLVPKSVFEGEVRTAQALAASFELKHDDVVALFQGEIGVYHDGADLIIPAPVVARVLRRHTPVKR